MAMAMIFINCGFPLSIAMGGFGSIEKHTGIYDSITWLAKPLFKIGIIEVSGSDVIIAIAVLMIIGTALFLNSRAFSSQGVAYATFAGIFWVPFLTSSTIILSIANDFPGLNILWLIFLLVSVLIFAMAMVQLPTGGQKSHV